MGRTLEPLFFKRGINSSLDVIRLCLVFDISLETLYKIVRNAHDAGLTNTYGFPLPAPFALDYAIRSLGIPRVKRGLTFHDDFCMGSFVRLMDKCWILDVTGKQVSGQHQFGDDAFDFSLDDTHLRTRLEHAEDTDCSQVFYIGNGRDAMMLMPRSSTFKFPEITAAVGLVDSGYMGRLVPLLRPTNIFYEDGYGKSPLAALQALNSDSNERILSRLFQMYYPTQLEIYDRDTQITRYLSMSAARHNGGDFSRPFCLFKMTETQNLDFQGFGGPSVEGNDRMGGLHNPLNCREIENYFLTVGTCSRPHRVEKFKAFRDRGKTVQTGEELKQLFTDIQTDVATMYNF